MKKNTPALLAVLAASLGMLGCENNSYSKAIKYAVRTDPLVIDKTLGEDRWEPDRPGMFPLMSIKALEEPFNPLYVYRNDLGKKLRDPTLLRKKDRKDLENHLVVLFGTPERPHVQVDSTIREALKLQQEDEEGRGLVNGSRLYRVHCLHCHGVTGDGRGPTSSWVNPHPRDYRQGLFKFMSVDQSSGAKPPRRDDLFRIIHHGVEGTAMPSFALLAAAELEDLVSYVIHLSIRGRVEYDTIVNSFIVDKGVLTLDPDRPEPLETQMDSFLMRIAGDWVESQSKAIPVSPYPYDDKGLKDSILRGYQLFKGEPENKPDWPSVDPKEAKAANCVSCHKDFGRQAMFKYDEWGTLTKPRDLTQGIFRGGRRPVDLYYRVHSGISGSGMTPFGKVLPKTDKADPLWDLVNLVRTVPYPAMRKSMGIFID